MKDCKFCGNNTNCDESRTDDSYLFNCHICGPYLITRTAYGTELSHGLQLISDEQRAFFCGYIRNNSSGANPIRIDSGAYDKIPSLVSPYLNESVVDKINRVVLLLGQRSSEMGHQIGLEVDRDYTLAYLKSGGELSHILQYLHDARKIHYRPFMEGECIITLLPDGWLDYEALRKRNADSKKVFFAVKFDADGEYKKVFAQVILPVCSELGFNAVMSNPLEHNEEISNKIIADIKESKFIIADFTHQNQGVYYEAGFAKGFGLEVVKTCKKSDRACLHFDTNHYPYILWETFNELRKELTAYIRAIIL